VALGRADAARVSYNGFGRCYVSTREPVPRHELRPPETPLVTWEILRQMPDDGKRYELFEGDLEVSPSPFARHQEVIANLFVLLLAYVRARGLGKVFLAPLDVIFDQHNVAQPDILFVAKERLSIVRDWVFGAPDLAIEVTSQDTAKDHVTKRRQYQKFGVKHYWILDPSARTLEEFILGADGVYRAGATLRGNETFKPAAFPELEIPLAQVWA
jgi:Uma2 family endonuclease